MFFVRKRSANVAAAKGFVCAKAKRQQQHDGRHGVGNFGNATRRGVLKLSPSISTDVWTPVSAASLSVPKTFVERS
ncbi:hypothetical protein P4562_01250 [Lysinibacillus xylanilyticus]|uniref:hypothetical protein n=1 Tax=Lysinibacillus xylanilyticus TaxID=582475 RepID=UPI002E233C67|nr:hypothetical protein [Lysinibacillus xylanilyticus]